MAGCRYQWLVLGSRDPDPAVERQRCGLRETGIYSDLTFDAFNARFWSEEEGFYAFALDGDTKQVVSIAPNPGQCLWSGIVPPDRARRVADRLMSPTFGVAGAYGPCRRTTKALTPTPTRQARSGRMTMASSR